MLTHFLRCCSGTGLGGGFRQVAPPCGLANMLESRRPDHFTKRSSQHTGETGAATKPPEQIENILPPVVLGKETCRFARRC